MSTGELYVNEGDYTYYGYTMAVLTMATVTMAVLTMATLTSKGTGEVSYLTHHT